MHCRFNDYFFRRFFGAVAFLRTVFFIFAKDFRAACFAVVLRAGVAFSTFFEPAPIPSATRVKTTPAAVAAAAPNASAMTDCTAPALFFATAFALVFAVFA